MKYVYTVVYKLVGLILVPGQGPKELVADAKRGVRAVITDQPDELCLNVDRDRAVRSLMLRRFCGLDQGANFDEDLAAELLQLRQKRKDDLGSAAALVIDISSEVEDFPIPDEREHREFLVSFDNPPKEPLRSAAKVSVAAVVTAVTLGSDRVLALKKLADSVVFFRGDGKPVFGCSPTLHAAGVVALSVSDEDVTLLGKWYPKLAADPSLGEVGSLLASSYHSEGDAVRSFLAAWKALERFVDKTFGRYEQPFFAGLLGGVQPDAFKKHLVRCHEEMGKARKYSLNDRFRVVSYQLCPADADRDADVFSRAKDVRDRLAHREEVEDSELPVAAVRTLVRKYVRLHLE